MNYAAIKKNDIANGPGVRVSLFVSGCRRHCKNCFNRETWDFAYGKPFTDAVAKELLEALDHDFVSGLTILGGEPLEPENQEGVLSVAKLFRQKFSDKTLWCYTGFDLEKELLAGKVGDISTVRELMSIADVLVDGPFVEEKKNPALLFRGSSNQRILDSKRSVAENRAVPLSGKWERSVGSGDINE